MKFHSITSIVFLLQLSFYFSSCRVHDNESYNMINRRSNKITDFPITNDGDDAVEAPNQFTKSMSKIIYTHPELFQNSDQFFVQTKMWIKWWKTMLKELGGLIVRNEKDLNDFQKYKLYLFIKKQLANTLAE